MRTIAHPFVTSDDSDLDLLDRCYKTACEALHSEYNIEIPSLDGLMIIPLTNALLVLYAVGLRDENALTLYAVSRGLIASADLETWRSST